MKKIAEYVTGSQRGYIGVANRGVNSELIPIPADLTGKRGNYRKAMELLIRLREIDEKYPDLRQIEREQWGYTAIDQWNGMIDALTT